MVKLCGSSENGYQLVAEMLGFMLFSGSWRPTGRRRSRENSAYFLGFLILLSPTLYHDLAYPPSPSFAMRMRCLDMRGWGKLGTVL